MADSVGAAVLLYSRIVPTLDVSCSISQGALLWVATVEFRELGGHYHNSCTQLKEMAYAGSTVAYSAIAALTAMEHDTIEEQETTDIQHDLTDSVSRLVEEIKGLHRTLSRTHASLEVVRSNIIG
jgi:hypothetical protein